jgi:hypothetical protein
MKLMKQMLGVLWPAKRRVYRRKRYDPERVIRSFLQLLERLRPVMQPGGGPVPHGVLREKP